MSVLLLFLPNLAWIQSESCLSGMYCKNHWTTMVLLFSTQFPYINHILTMQKIYPPKLNHIKGYIQIYIYINTNTQTHTHIDIHTHTHIYTHIHIESNIHLKISRKTFMNTHKLKINYTFLCIQPTQQTYTHKFTTINRQRSAQTLTCILTKICINKQKNTENMYSHTNIYTHANRHSQVQ